MEKNLTILALIILFVAFINLQIQQHKNFDNGSKQEIQHSQARIDANIAIKEAL